MNRSPFAPAGPIAAVMTALAVGCSSSSAPSPSAADLTDPLCLHAYGTLVRCGAQYDMAALMHGCSPSESAPFYSCLQDADPDDCNSVAMCL